MAIVNQKPEYWITVRDNFWCFLEAEDGVARLYEPTVYRSPVVKSIGITGTVAEGNIYASGIVYDYTRQVQGAEIALDAVALERILIDKATGATVNGAYAFDKSNDVGNEFAFGYYLEAKDGSYVYYWHPRCLLTQNDDTVETSTDSAVDPTRSFTIRSLPTSEGVWRVRYYADKSDSSALKPEEFFASVRYTDGVQAASLTVGSPKVGTACAATVVYADSATPTTPTISYAWYISETADGEFEAIEGATSASYTPAAADEGSYIKCVAKVSGSAIGYVESEAKQVAAA